MGYARYNHEREEFEEIPAEMERGCGFRIIEALYMVAPPVSIQCDRAVVLFVCPVCGAGVKQSRGWTWIEPFDLLGGTHQEQLRGAGVSPLSCSCDKGCPICWPPTGRAGLLWVGRRHYNVQTFLREARGQGVSKRIRCVPRGFESGTTVVYLAHPGAIPPGHQSLGGHGEVKDDNPRAGIVCAYYPRVEQIFAEGDRDSEVVKRAIKRGITPVLVPDVPRHRTGRRSE